MAGPSIPLKDLTAFLDRTLLLRNYPDDASANGLQVEGRQTVRKVGLGVDACEAVFRSAADKKVDLLIVHHGLIWGGLKSISGLMRQRISQLLESGISLYACHLPLDGHPELGNNAQILKLLGMRRAGLFAEYHGAAIGVHGKLPKALELREFGAKVDAALRTESHAIGFGRRVKHVGIVSGGGWFAINEAERLGIDTLLTGEPAHSAYHIARELNVNLVFAGHYATEAAGVKAVGALLRKEFRLPSEFIDYPTGL